MTERYVKSTVIERGQYRSGAITQASGDSDRTFADFFPPAIKGGIGRPSPPICRFRIVVEAVVLASHAKRGDPNQLSIADERLLEEAGK